jgi:hypothetical protein
MGMNRTFGIAGGAGCIDDGNFVIRVHVVELSLNS